jgi:flagellar export protein FliJ
MPFQFPLQNILHYRQSLEHQQELRLRAANQQVARVQRLGEQIDGRRRELQEARSAALSAGVSSAELRFALRCEAELVRRRWELQQELERQQQLRDQQREIFQQARRTRETLEGVRDQQARLYQREAARREQRNLDDLFLLRKEYLRRG